MVRGLIEMNQGIVTEDQEHELPRPEPDDPEYVEAICENASGHLVLPVRHSHGLAVVLFPSVEPPRIWLDRLHRAAVQQACVGKVFEELVDFET